MTEVLVYIGINNEYKIETVGKEIISYVRNNFVDTAVKAVVTADNVTINNSIDELKQLPVEKIYIIKNDLLQKPESNTVAFALKTLINEINPDIFLVGATPSGREIAPRLASKLDVGLTADCTALSLDENHNLLATRPTYGGKMLATIYSKTKPNCATIRPGAFKLQPTINITPEIIDYYIDFSGIKNRIEILKSEIDGFQETKDDLEQKIKFDEKKLEDTLEYKKQLDDDVIELTKQLDEINDKLQQLEIAFKNEEIKREMIISGQISVASQERLDAIKKELESLSSQIKHSEE